MLKLPLFAAREGADVIYKDASKAEGIKALLEYYGMSREDVIAFGDSMNDYDMIHYVQHGIVMGNGLDEVKAVADYVTSDLHKDGIYNGLHHFGLI